MIEKINRMFKLLRNDDVSLKYFFGASKSISSLELVLALKNHCNDFNTIIDVGANVGQFAVAAKRLFPSSKIYSFEPIPEAAKTLKNNTQKFSDIEIFCTALGSTNGSSSFNLNEYSHSSSILDLNEENKDIFPGVDKIIKIQVQINRLDDFINKLEIKRPSLLKLDVQGFEKEVLKGSSETLNSIDYILTETSIIPFYKNEILFDEMNDFIKSLGFKFVAPLAFLRTDDFKIAQMDVLYKKVL